MVCRPHQVALIALGVGVGGASCVDIETRELTQPIEAACEAQVIGVGLVDVETDYLPGVVGCENGAASLEALKAQAVAARSYLYYRLEISGDIEDGTSDQVYSCGREPTADHRLAVAETSGQVLRYQETQVAAFYVAGALQDGPDCIGGTDDPTDTEMWVTYNEGLSGDSIEQTMLGFVDPGNYANRGCMSQNGSDCLSDRGDDYDSILRFYYGDDIELVTAEGPCVDGSGADAGPGAPGDANDGCGCQASRSGSAPLFALFALIVPGALRRRRRASES